VSISWRLDHDQATRFMEWLEYLEDMIEKYDDDWPVLKRSQDELRTLLAQDRLVNPPEIQPELPRPLGK
jgi:hypothetical protein